MLRNFKVFTPSSLQQTLELIDGLKEPFRFICGGTDVLVRLKDNPAYAKLLVDISGLSELSKIEEHKSTYVVGATCRHTQTVSYEPFRKHYPGLVEAVNSIGSPQIRALGTLGGNIGNSSPAGDSIPPLLAFDAELELRSVSANRKILLRDFFTGPGKSVLAPNEIITKVIIPKCEGFRSGWVRLGQRKGFAISKVSVAVAFRTAVHPNGSVKLEDIRIALGAVAPKVIRASKTEKFMIEEQNLTPSLIAKAATLLSQEASPITDIRSSESYRRAMCSALFSELMERLSK